MVIIQSKGCQGVPYLGHIWLMVDNVKIYEQHEVHQAYLEGGGIAFTAGFIFKYALPRSEVSFQSQNGKFMKQNSNTSSYNHKKQCEYTIKGYLKPFCNILGPISLKGLN